MSSTPAPIDRRAALKARSRRSILDAAANLMHRSGGTSFSVDELAAAADVSRRTVFNHFDSLEDLVIAVAEEMFGDLMGDIEAQTASPSSEPETVLADLAAIADADRMVPAVASLVAIFGGVDGPPSNRDAVLMQRAMALFTVRISAAMTGRHPDLDPLSLDLVVAAFLGGMLGFVERWRTETGADDTPESRSAWDHYVARLIAVLREPGS
jgi:TetR/AcrR family transcriptional regulator, regulator of autoinduction and epiphytic fitness